MIRTALIIPIFVLVILVVPNFSYAISDSFSVSQLIGEDSIPPTTPNPVTATPVAATQIDVAWGASTDDQDLTGYRLFRDTVQIATTSLITYSDTGLTPSTTYSYTVEAYDWFFNISTTSTAAATTTLQAVVTSTPEAGNTSTWTGPKLVELGIQTTQTSVSMEWTTNRFAQYSLRWGKVSSYDLGFVQNELYKKNHKTSITDLEPGTTYVYELIAYNQRGRAYVLSKDTFTTKLANDLIAPINVSNLQALAEGDSVLLSWDNSSEDDFSKVRIVRNYNFYPRDISNGYIIYEGSSESFFDKEAFALYDTQYYTIFSYDDSGNVSSGAIISISKYGYIQLVVPKPYVPPFDSIINTTSTDDSQFDRINIDFLDVKVIQNGVHIESSDNIVRVINTSPVIFEISYEVLPEHLKAIIVTIEDPTSKSVSYMLRVNKDKTAYQAVVPPRKYLGKNLLTFSVYDFKIQLLTTFDGVLQVEEELTTSKIIKQIFYPEFVLQNVVPKFLLSILVLFLIYLVYIRKRSS